MPARLTSVLDALQALEAVLGVGESQICVPDGVLALLDSVQEALHGHGVGLLGHELAWDVDSLVEQPVRRPHGDALVDGEVLMPIAPEREELHGGREVVPLRRPMTRLAEAAEVHRKSIIQIEAGRVAAKISTLHGIAHALGVPLPELVAPVCARHPKAVGTPTPIV